MIEFSPLLFTKKWKKNPTLINPHTILYIHIYTIIFFSFYFLKGSWKWHKSTFIECMRRRAPLIQMKLKYLQIFASKLFLSLLHMWVSTLFIQSLYDKFNFFYFFYVHFFFISWKHLKYFSLFFSFVYIWKYNKKDFE